MCASDRSVTARRCACSKAADEKRQWYHSQCCPAENAETVHIREQMRLVTELPVDICYGGRMSVASGDTVLRKEASQGTHALL